MLCTFTCHKLDLSYSYNSYVFIAGDAESKPSTARASLWMALADQRNWSWKHWDCQGKWVRQICIFGVGDLPWLYHRPELFANKFFSSYEWLAYDCMEELMYNRTMMGSRSQFDPTYYLNLPFVKNKHLIVTPKKDTWTTL